MRRRSPSSTRTKQPHAPNSRLSMSQGTAEDGPLAPHDLQPAKERRAPCSDSQDAAEEDDSVDADAPFPGPVVIGIEIEPESELVERERRAGAVADCH